MALRDGGHFSASTPAVADGRAFVTSEGALYAVALASGDESYDVPDVAARWSSPFVDSGDVFAVSDDSTGRANELVAVGAGDGTERWRVTVGTDSPPGSTKSAQSFKNGSLPLLNQPLELAKDE